MKDKKAIKKLKKVVAEQSGIQTALIGAFQNLTVQFDKAVDQLKAIQLHVELITDIQEQTRPKSTDEDMSQTAEMFGLVRWCVGHNQIADLCDHPNRNGEFEYRTENGDVVPDSQEVVKNGD